MGSGLRVCVLAAWVLSFAIIQTVTLRADDFHSNMYGYSVEIPASWVQWPDSTLQSAIKKLDGSQNAQIVWEVAFQPDELSIGEYPYLIVSILTYKSSGVDRQIGEVEITKVVEQLGGQDVEKVLDRYGSDVARELIKAATFDKPRFDEANHRFFMPMSSVVDGVKVQGVMGAFFGRKALIQLSCYARAEDWETHKTTFAGIIDSFRFDTETAYNEVDAALHSSQTQSRSTGFSWSKIGAKVLLYSAIGLIIAIVLVIVSVMRKLITSKGENLICPKCGLLNPLTSEQCDCGYNFP